MKQYIVITGGGSGGHVFPALAVTEILGANPDYQFAWIGSSKGIEREIVGRWGMEFHGIPAGKLRRYLSLQNILDLFRTLAGFFKSFYILARLKPVAVFSKGGFVSVPPVLAAGLLGIPVIGHESDSDPGLATRLNMRWTRRICIPYEQGAAQYPAGKVVVTGNPVRREIFDGEAARGLAVAGFDPADPRPVLLVVGGSLGARQLNQLVWQHLDALLADWRVIHQTGRLDQSGPAARPGEYHVAEFFPETYPHVLACADLVLSRAGAGTVWELAARSKPAVFVPLVAGSRGDQARNARLCQETGAALVWDGEPADTKGQALVASLSRLARDPQARSSMAMAWASLFIPDGAQRIARVVQDVLEGKD